MKRIVPLVMLVAVLLPAGCVSTTTAQRQAIQFVEPKVSSGIIAPAGIEAKLADAFDAIRAAQTPKVVPRSMREPTVSLIARSTPRPAETIFIPPQPLADAAKLGRFPADVGRLITVGRRNATELDEIIDALLLRFKTETGYAIAGPAILDFLPPLPNGIARGDVLARSTDEGLRLLRIGYKQYLSQASQIWAYAVTVRPEDVVANDDLDAVEPAVKAALESIETMRANLSLADLEAEVIQLSYVAPKAALIALRNLGVGVVTGDDRVPTATTFDDLPIVTAMPAPGGKETSLVGGKQEAMRDLAGMFAIPTVATPLDAETVSGRTSQLLVLYHPAHPEQFSRVLQVLNELIDVPARQVFIEGMIVEISEEGLTELGIEWQFEDATVRVMAGALIAGNAPDTLNILNDDALNVEGNWSVRLRALVRENKAQILARPSVITLDNRQATIRIGTDIPIATSEEGFGGGSSKIGFNFRYLPTGILLNVRPRIDAKGEEISMQIDTTVSATVPGADLEVRSPEGTLLAAAPTVASRRV